MCSNVTCSMNGVCKSYANGSVYCDCFNEYYGNECEYETESMKIKKIFVSIATIVAIIFLVLFYVVFVIMDVLTYYQNKSKLMAKRHKKKRKKKKSKKNPSKDKFHPVYVSRS